MLVDRRDRRAHPQPRVRGRCRRRAVGGVLRPSRGARGQGHAAWSTPTHVERLYDVTGELFFASTHDFVHAFDYDAVGVERVEIDLTDARIWDTSAVVALDAVVAKFAERGIIDRARRAQPPRRAAPSQHQRACEARSLTAVLACSAFVSLIRWLPGSFASACSACCARRRSAPPRPQRMPRPRSRRSPSTRAWCPCRPDVRGPDPAAVAFVGTMIGKDDVTQVVRFRIDQIARRLGGAMGDRRLDRRPLRRRLPVPREGRPVPHRRRLRSRLWRVVVDGTAGRADVRRQRRRGCRRHLRDLSETRRSGADGEPRRHVASIRV